MLEQGITNRMEMIVGEEHTALAMGSGELEVFATPAMIALAEKTAWTSVSEYLEKGEGTVGTRMDVKHLSATPVGAKVWCESLLTEADGRRLCFQVKIYDEAGIIGEGEHERFIIKNERFYEKANNKFQTTTGRENHGI